jgi:hypothetical protein
MKDSAKPLDVTAQLVMLRDITRRFGAVHDAQALQIRAWPFVVDPSLKKSECAVDVENKTAAFAWEGSSLKMDFKYKARLKQLDINMKFLFGDNWRISVKLDGASIFPLKDTNVKSSGRSRSRKPKRTRKARK